MPRQRHRLHKSLFFILVALLVLLHERESAPLPTVKQARSPQSAAHRDEKIAPTRPPEYERSFVHDVVAVQNRESRRQRDAMTADGWQIVTTAPPKPLVMNLEVSALPKLESEIQVQLQTNTYRGEALGRIRLIALQASSEKTRIVALEALGRSRDPQAQELLVDAFERLPSRPERRLIVGLLKPLVLDDAATRFLVEATSRQDVPLELKRQAVGALAGATLANKIAPEELLARLPVDWHEQYRRAMDEAPRRSH